MAYGSYQKVRDYVGKLTEQAAEKAFNTMMREQRFDMYLYFKIGALEPAYDQPEGLQIAINERLPCNIDKAGLQSWITSRVQRLPFLPPNLSE
jgi:hypothetical protein